MFYCGDEKGRTLDILELLKVIGPILGLIGGLIGLLAAYLKFRSRPQKDVEGELLRKKLVILLKEKEPKFPPNTKPLWWLQKKTRIDAKTLRKTLAQIAVAGEEKSWMGKETWKLDKGL